MLLEKFKPISVDDPTTRYQRATVFTDMHNHLRRSEEFRWSLFKSALFLAAIISLSGAITVLFIAALGWLGLAAVLLVPLGPLWYVFVRGRFHNQLYWQRLWETYWSLEREKTDDRYPLIKTFLESVRRWNETTALVDRLIVAAECERIPLASLEPIIAACRENEEYLLQERQFVLRLASEGSLGSSHLPLDKLPLLLEANNDRRRAIEEHTQTLRQTIERMAADLEVENVGRLTAKA